MNKTVLTASAALAVLQAAAQVQGPSEASLRPVVVTATPGVAAAAFDTAASVDVIDQAAQRQHQLGVNLSESLVRVPGVMALNRQNYAQDLQISIRGFGARSTFGVRGLRLYADGIPATMPDGQGQVSHFDLSSAERMEVLRGPFSSLYGNSSGGVISLFTADGGPRKVIEASSAFGGDGVRRNTLRFSGEEGAWKWNVGATQFETDGLREHSAAQRNAFNGKLKWAVSDDTRLTFVLNGMDMPDVQDPLGLTRTEYEADPRQASPAALQFNTRKSADQLQAGAILEQRLSPIHSLKLTAWRGRRGTQQFQAIPIAAQTPPSHPGGVISLARDFQGLDAQWVARTRLAGGALTTTVGLMSDSLEENRRGTLNFSGTTLGVMGSLRRNEDNRVRSFDQYAQARWELERVSLTAGVRHSVVRFESRDRYVAPGNADDSGSARYGATTPVVGAVFHVNDAINAYAAAGTGFETPTFNELAYRPGAAGMNFNLRSASSRQWELGVKAEPARNWRVNAAIFQAKTSDEIVVLSNSGGRSTFQNAGDTRRRGFEAALAGRWAEDWSANVAVTYLEASYRSAFLTCVAAPCTTPTTSVAAGSRIPGVPRFSAFAELLWRHRPWGLEAGLELRHTGRMPVDDRNTDFAPSATTFNIRAGLTQTLDRWSFREFVRVDNLTGRNYVGSVIVNEGNRRFFEPAPGRTWLVGVNAAYSF